MPNKPVVILCDFDCFAVLTPKILHDIIVPLVEFLFAGDAKMEYIHNTHFVLIVFKDEETFMFYTLKHTDISKFVRGQIEEKVCLIQNGSKNAV